MAQFPKTSSAPSFNWPCNSVTPKSLIPRQPKFWSQNLYLMFKAYRTAHCTAGCCRDSFLPFCLFLLLLFLSLLPPILGPAKLTPLKSMPKDHIFWIASAKATIVQVPGCPCGSHFSNRQEVHVTTPWVHPEIKQATETQDLGAWR